MAPGAELSPDDVILALIIIVIAVVAIVKTMRATPMIGNVFDEVIEFEKKKISRRNKKSKKRNGR